MKKRIILVMLFTFFVSSQTVFAKASASISVSTSSTIIGNSGSATLTVSSDDVLGQIYGTFSCGGLGSKDLTYVNSTGENAKSKSYTISWTAKSSGTYTCSVSGLQVGTLSHPEDGVYSISATSKTITVISGGSTGSSGGSSSGGGATSDKKTYSSDNTLSSLSVEGYDITPNFDKDTTEYTLEVDESVEKVKVNAQANDSKATVQGAGEINLTSGENTVEIKVIAENGNEKVYKIVITVKDQNPISVSIDGKNYTVVKKNNDVIDKLEHYEESSIQIDGQDVVAYVNDKSKITLVILKDDENQVAYYVYDAEENTYRLYVEVSVGNLTIYPLDMEDDLLPFGYQKYSFEIGDIKLDGYQLNKNSDFHLLYAMNVETGEKSLYVYDEKEGTVQRYNDEIEKYYSSELEYYRKYFYITFSVLVAVLIVLLVVFIVKLKRKKRKNKLKI